MGPDTPGSPTPGGGQHLPGSHSRVGYRYTVKKGIVFPARSRDVINQTLPGWEKIHNSRPGGGRLVTSRYTVYTVVAIVHLLTLFYTPSWLDNHAL